MTDQHRPPRPPRARRTRVRNRSTSSRPTNSRRRYDPETLWDSHITTGAYAKPGSVMGTLNDLNPAYNPIDLAWAVMWACWCIVRRRQWPKTIWIPAADVTVNEVRAEWARLHIDSCVVAMSNSGMTVLVGARQYDWACYVLGRMLAGEPVPAWE